MLESRIVEETLRKDPGDPDIIQEKWYEDPHHLYDLFLQPLLDDLESQNRN